MFVKFYNSTQFRNLRHPVSIFLAGPTDRHKEASPWRQEFIRNASKIGILDETVFIIPEFCTGRVDSNQNLATYPEATVDLNSLDTVNLRNISKTFSKERIYRWERSNLRSCDYIVFWVARNFEENRLALTTNIEFGNFYDSGKCICGSPPDADQVDYLKWVWQSERGERWFSSLKEMTEHLGDLMLEKIFR